MFPKSYKTDLPKNIVILRIIFSFLLFLSILVPAYAREDDINNSFGIGRIDSVRSLVFSPDGKKLSATRYLWDWRRAEIINDSKIVTSFSPDSKYYADFRANLYRSSSDMKIYSTFQTGSCSPAFSDDSKYYIYFQSLRGTAWTPTGYDYSVVDGISRINLCDLKKKKVIETRFLPLLRPLRLLADSTETSDKKVLFVVAISYSWGDIVLDDIIEWESFLKKLKEHKTPAVKRVWSFMDKDTKQLIKRWTHDYKPDTNFKIRIIKSMQDILMKSNLYNTESFKNIPLKKIERKKLEEIMNKNDTWIYFIPINRILLERVFRNEIRELQPPANQRYWHGENHILKIYVLETNPFNVVKKFDLPDSYAFSMTTVDDLIILVNSDDGFFNTPKKITRINIKTGTRKDIEFEKNAENIAVSPDGSLVSYITDINDKDYWILTEEDILDWKGILLKLRSRKKYDINHFWDILDKDSKNIIKNYSSQLSEKDKTQLINNFNKLLKSNKFFSRSFFPNLIDNWEGKILYMKGINLLSTEKYQKFNRLLLESLFPGKIKSKKETAKFSIKVRPLEKEEPILEIKGGADFERVHALAISPDNKYLAVGFVGVEDRMGGVKIYEIKTGKLIRTLIPPMEKLKEK